MEERVKKKKYNTRKCINIIIDLCQKFDSLETIEYNLTRESSDLWEFLNTLYKKTNASALLILRVTQHVDKDRFGPWYICIVSELIRFTYEPFAVCVIGKQKSSTSFEFIYSISYDECRENIVNEIYKNIKKEFKMFEEIK